MTWDWTQVSRIIGEHSTHWANELVMYRSNTWIYYNMFKQINCKLFKNKGIKNTICLQNTHTHTHTHTYIHTYIHTHVYIVFSFRLLRRVEMPLKKESKTNFFMKCIFVVINFTYVESSVSSTESNVNIRLVSIGYRSCRSLTYPIKGNEISSKQWMR